MLTAVPMVLALIEHSRRVIVSTLGVLYNLERMLNDDADRCAYGAAFVMRAASVPYMCAVCVHMHTYMY